MINRSTLTPLVALLVTVTTLLLATALGGCYHTVVSYVRHDTTRGYRDLHRDSSLAIASAPLLRIQPWPLSILEVMISGKEPFRLDSISIVARDAIRGDTLSTGVELVELDSHRLRAAGSRSKGTSVREIDSVVRTIRPGGYNTLWWRFHLPISAKSLPHDIAIDMTLYGTRADSAFLFRSTSTYFRHTRSEPIQFAH